MRKALTASGPGLRRARAAVYPDRPVKIIVPFAPAGPTDIMARILITYLGDAIGGTMIVENKPGAGGNIGIGAVAHADPDGYTLLLGSSGSVTASPAVMKNIPYDTPRDFTALGPIHVVPMVLTASPNLKVNSYAECAALAKARGGKLSVASAGNGSSNHLAIEMIKSQGGYDQVSFVERRRRHVRA